MAYGNLTSHGIMQQDPFAPGYPGAQMGSGSTPGTNMPGDIRPDPQMGTGYPTGGIRPGPTSYPTGGIRPDPQMGTGPTPGTNMPGDIGQDPKMGTGDPPQGDPTYPTGPTIPPGLTIGPTIPPGLTVGPTIPPGLTMPDAGTAPQDDPWGSAADRYQIGGSNSWTNIRGAEGAQLPSQPQAQPDYPTGGIRPTPVYPTGGIRPGPASNAAFAPGARM